MALLSIDRALELLLEQVTPKEEESVALAALGASSQQACARHALTRMRRTQRWTATPLRRERAWSVVGEAAAGKLFDRPVREHQAVRIFTGGVLPEGTDSVLIKKMPTVRASSSHRSRSSKDSTSAPRSTCARRPAHGSESRSTSDLAALGGQDRDRPLPSSARGDHLDRRRSDPARAIARPGKSSTATRSSRAGGATGGGDHRIAH